MSADHDPDCVLDATGPPPIGDPAACSECGALVADAVLHRLWHRALDHVVLIKISRVDPVPPHG